jgi:hypothetical protein
LEGPGLAIQLATGVGLLRRLELAMERWKSPHDSHRQKLELSRKTFGVKQRRLRPLRASGS